MKDKKKQRQKVIPHCYKRNQSRTRTLSNSCLSISQLVQIGSYKKRINDLSRNNRHLAAALQDARLEVAVQHNMLKDCAKDCNNILFARLKLNEMAKNVEKFVTDLEEVRSYLNFELLSDKNPFTHKRGSPSERLIKQPAINCIEEVSYESSVNEVVAPENASTSASNLKTIHGSDDNKVSDILPNYPENNVDENMEIAPILFADDSEGKKSSVKSKISKKVSDPDNVSLTPELNIDLTSVKLKRKSSRRQTQFLFPGSRSTSKGKASAEKENALEELVTPAKPVTPSLNLEQNAPEMKKTLEEIFKSPINIDNKEKEPQNASRFPENHLKVVHNTDKCDPSNVSTVNPEKHSKTTIVLEAQPGESNQTVHLCEDMELTEVIRPVHQIIVTNDLPFDTKSLDNANLDNDIIKENVAPGFSEEMKDGNINKEIICERDRQELFTIEPNPLKQITDDIQLPKISENDEVQNVGMITFCEPNDENVASRATKSSLRGSRRVIPIKYAVFFSSDESDDNSSFEMSLVKSKTSKRKTVIPAKPGKPSKKTGGTMSHDKVFSETESEMEEKNSLKCSIDALHSEKSEEKLEKKSAKKSKDIKISKSKDIKISKNKDDLPEHVSQKCSVASKDGNFKVNKSEDIKKLGPNHENDLPKHSSNKSTSKVKNIKSNENTNVKKLGPSRENDLPEHSSNKSTSKVENIKFNGNANVKKLGLSHKNDFPKHSSHKSLTKSKNENIKIDEDVIVKKCVPSHEHLKNLIFSPISSPGILKKTQSNFQTTKEIGSETPLNRIMHNDNLDDTITNVIESPKSELRKVSFAPTDLVCKFRKMSVSKKIAENKKVRRTSKSMLDFEELLEQEGSKTSHPGADNFSESTNKKAGTDNPVTLNFSDDTELYTFQFPTNNFLIAPTTDDLMRKSFLNVTQKNVKKTSKTSKKVHSTSKPLKSTDKLSLKKCKDHSKNTEPKLKEVLKERDVLLFESPVSVCKPAKRKSLFKEHLDDDDSKENINHQIQDKTKNIHEESDKIIKNTSTKLSAQNNKLKKSTSTKNQRKTQGNLKKLSDKHKNLEPTPEIKKKKPSIAKKSLENSPILKDTVNLPEAQDRMSRKRSSRPVCLKEPSLGKKLRRE